MKNTIKREQSPSKLEALPRVSILREAKRIIYSMALIAALVSSLILPSCDDYLSVVPKGSKIPETLADFEALLRNETYNHQVVITQALTLLNDLFRSKSSLSKTLSTANYLWDETADRIALNNTDEAMYYYGYSGISTFNLVIENALTATEATEAEKREVWAQAKVLRAMGYFCQANYYADTYNAATASSKLSVPLIASADVNASYTQVTIQEIYDFMLKDMEEALPYLNETSATVLHPNLGTAYAFYAQLCLQMGNFTQALQYAGKALEQNSLLYDWTSYYEDNKTLIEAPDSYTRIPSPMGYDYIENYNFRHGATPSYGNISFQINEHSLPTYRAALFEPGDARFASRWKLRTVGENTYYYGTLTGYLNYGGITTTEVYLIKAECLARDGDLDGAMDALNAVREKRILAGAYQPRTASTLAEAMQYIMQTKNNELIMTLTPFADTRRLNNEGVYNRTLSKVVDGVTYTLLPTSHMWTMPFPQGAVDNHGNGTITQNVER